MSSLEQDIEMLENAMRLFFQTMKRPQRWASVTAQAKVTIDRPAAVILQTLLLNEPNFCRVQDLAVQLGIEPPSVTRKTQELEQLGYLRRTRDEQDRRALGLAITPEGRAVAERLHKVQRESISDTLQDWPKAEREQLVKLFERFSSQLAEQVNSPAASQQPARTI